MFLQNVCCAIRAWLTVWVEYLFMAAWPSVYVSVFMCALMCAWLEMLSMLYYTKAQTTQRLIRETYQTPALGGIDFLCLDLVDHSCPG